MELLNLTKDDIFKKKDIDNSNRIDFYESYSDAGIYNKEAYLQDRPIYNEFIKDYNIEPVNNNFNQMIHERKVREEKEIAENLAEISITSDPRITKYEDTYSLTPYATYLLTPLSDIDGEDIVSRFDSCYGEWVTKHQDRCDINTEPCKRIKQHFRIHNPGYTGEHCRDEDGRRLRRGDTRHVFCNHYQNPKCNGHGECIRNNSSNTCICKDGYSGPNCETPLPSPPPSPPPPPPPAPTPSPSPSPSPSPAPTPSPSPAPPPSPSPSPGPSPSPSPSPSPPPPPSPSPATVKCSSFTDCDTNRIPDSSKSDNTCLDNVCTDELCCINDRIGTCKCTKPAFPDEFPDLCYDGGDVDKGVTRHKSFCIDQTTESNCKTAGGRTFISPKTCTFVPKP